MKKQIRGRQCGLKRPRAGIRDKTKYLWRTTGENEPSWPIINYDTQTKTSFGAAQTRALPLDSGYHPFWRESDVTNPFQSKVSHGETKKRPCMKRKRKRAIQREKSHRSHTIGRRLSVTVPAAVHRRSPHAVRSERSSLRRASQAQTSESDELGKERVSGEGAGDTRPKGSYGSKSGIRPASSGRCGTKGRDDAPTAAEEDVVARGAETPARRRRAAVTLTVMKHESVSGLSVGVSYAVTLKL
jgi:hypothetical protein